MNYIEFTATVSGEPVAFKVGVPHTELFTEMETLLLHDGRGVVRLLDSDQELGAMLIQRAQPGTMLWQLRDNRKETEIAATVIRSLLVTPPSTHHLPTYSKWVERAFRLTRTTWDTQEYMPRTLLDRAEKAFQEIMRNATEQVVLHGDLHHENILFDERTGWVAIDPKGVIGPHCLEVGRFLQNQLPSTLSIERCEEIMRERVHILSGALGYSSKTIAACGLVDCVLSHCWCFEEENGITTEWHHGVELARRLSQIMECA